MPTIRRFGMDEVVIGAKGRSRESSAVHLRTRTRCSIGQNEVSYWISGLILQGEMVVFRDSPDGLKIEKLLDVGRWSALDNLLDDLWLKKARTSLLKARIREEVQKAEDRGKKLKINELRAVLDLPRGFCGE